MDYNYASEDKTQRLRVIIITIAFSIIVLGIAAWAIIAIVGSRNSDENIAESPTIAAVDENKTAAVEEKVETAPATEGVSKTTESTTTSANKAAANKPATTATAVPETGPEELLPLAMVLGTGTAFAFSRKMAKNVA